VVRAIGEREVESLAVEWRLTCWIEGRTAASIVVATGTFRRCPWFGDRISAAKVPRSSSQSDVHGRVDSESLGTSLRLVGYCYSSQGQFAEALPWLERAALVVSKREGCSYTIAQVKSVAAVSRMAGYSPNVRHCQRDPADPSGPEWVSVASKFLRGLQSADDKRVS
jgi:hypothetical protein